MRTPIEKLYLLPVVERKPTLLEILYQQEMYKRIKAIVNREVAKIMKDQISSLFRIPPEEFGGVRSEDERK